MPSQPISPRRRTISTGKRRSRSCSSTTGATSLTMKSRIVVAQQRVLRREVEVHRPERTTGSGARGRSSASLPGWPAGIRGTPRRRTRRRRRRRPRGRRRGRRPRRSAGTSSSRSAATARRRPNSSPTMLGASRTGVLQQLRRSRRPGLVDRRTVRHGVGRPRHLYDVPRRAGRLPSNYDGLAAGSACRDPCGRRGRPESTRSSRPAAGSSASR